MGVGSGRARVADVAFHVIRGPLHPDWYITHRFLRITQGRWEADFRIIEGGHAIVFVLDSARITEIVAGPETALPEPGHLFQSSIRSERSASLRPAANVEYQSCFSVERVDPEVFRHLCDELMVKNSHLALFHRFGPSNRLAPSPLSRLDIDIRATGLSIQTFHTFPDECAIVRSQSLCEYVSENGTR